MDQKRRRNNDGALSAGANAAPPMRRASDQMMMPHTLSAVAPSATENRLAQIVGRITGLTIAVEDEATRLRGVADSVFGCEPPSGLAGESVRPTLPLIGEIEASLDALSGWLDAVIRQRRRLEDLV